MSGSIRLKFALIFGLALFCICFNSNRPIHESTPYKFPVLSFFPEMPVTNNSPTIEGVELGRHLFYDPILSKDSTFSCSSCHRQEVAFSDSPSRFSTGVNGEKMNRNTLPLFNLAWYSSMFWDGKAEDIEDQVFHPVRSHIEMDLDWTNAAKRINESDFYRSKFLMAFGNQPIDSLLIAKAIAQFERTIISNNSKYDKVLRGEAFFTSDEYEGFVLMNDQTKGDCLHCHSTDADALGTTIGFSNNGLDEAFEPEDYLDQGLGAISRSDRDIGKFKIPSLRNVAITAPYMHDGRFETLEEVLDFYSEGVKKSVNIDSKMGYAHQGGVKLAEEEKQQIVEFLKTLTDSTLLTNPVYSNPFIVSNGN